jgi:hypothetical protein
LTYFPEKFALGSLFADGVAPTALPWRHAPVDFVDTELHAYGSPPNP